MSSETFDTFRVCDSRCVVVVFFTASVLCHMFFDKQARDPPGIEHFVSVTMTCESPPVRHRLHDAFQMHGEDCGK